MLPVSVVSVVVGTTGVVVFGVVVVVVALGAAHPCFCVEVPPLVVVHVFIWTPSELHVDHSEHFQLDDDDEPPPPPPPELPEDTAVTVYAAATDTALPAASVAVHVALLSPAVDVSIPVIEVPTLGSKLSVAEQLPVIVPPTETLDAERVKDGVFGTVLSTVIARDVEFPTLPDRSVQATYQS